jgi:HD-GYP domain-containing protein (c-di-GMP phosphodiesterase class II)
VEKAVIEIHPEVGYEILNNIHFPWPVAEIVYQHHEHLDGSGYPRGLTDKDILLEAKIIAVADVVPLLFNSFSNLRTKPFKSMTNWLWCNNASA